MNFKPERTVENKNSSLESVATKKAIKADELKINLNDINIEGIIKETDGSILVLNQKKIK